MEVLFGDVNALVVAACRDLDLSRSWHEPVYLPQDFVAVPFDEDDSIAWACHVGALGNREFAIDLRSTLDLATRVKCWVPVRGYRPSPG